MMCWLSCAVGRVVVIGCDANTLLFPSCHCPWLCGSTSWVNGLAAAEEQLCFSFQKLLQMGDPADHECTPSRSHWHWGFGGRRETGGFGCVASCFRDKVQALNCLFICLFGQSKVQAFHLSFTAEFSTPPQFHINRTSRWKPPKLTPLRKQWFYNTELLRSNWCRAWTDSGKLAMVTISNAPFFLWSWFGGCCCGQGRCSWRRTGQLCMPSSETCSCLLLLLVFWELKHLFWQKSNFSSLL